jgi:hypothetical protein
VACASAVAIVAEALFATLVRTAGPFLAVESNALVMLAYLAAY